MTFPSIESTLLINQCRLLEQPYSQKFTDEVLTNPDVVMRSLKKKQIIKADRSLLLSEAKTHPSQSIVAEVASNMGCLKVWDTALDHGPPGTIAVVVSPQATKFSQTENVIWKVVTLSYHLTLPVMNISYPNIQI